MYKIATAKRKIATSIWNQYLVSKQSRPTLDYKNLQNNEKTFPEKES
jgi:hypothetical protein